MKPNKELAGVCGLFCGTCPSYIENECGGCTSATCVCDCFNGFKSCAEEKGVTMCYECTAFPCEKLADFSTKHVVNGICHHENVIKDLEEMKKIGVSQWVANQTNAHTCQKCGELIPWHQRECGCGKN